MLVLGLILVGHPDKTLVVMIKLLGIFWLINGILDVIAGITGHTDASRGWIIFGGVLATLAGLIVLNQSLIAGVIITDFLAIIIAFSIIINGLSQVFVGKVVSVSDTELSRKHSFGSSLIGTIYVIGGILLVTHPAWTAEALLILLGIWALVAGIAQIVIALKIRSAARSITANAKFST